MRNVPAWILAKQERSELRRPEDPCRDVMAMHQQSKLRLHATTGPRKPPAGPHHIDPNGLQTGTGRLTSCLLWSQHRRIISFWSPGWRHRRRATASGELRRLALLDPASRGARWRSISPAPCDGRVHQPSCGVSAVRRANCPSSWRRAFWVASRRSRPSRSILSFFGGVAQSCRPSATRWAASLCRLLRCSWIVARRASLMLFRPFATEGVEMAGVEQIAVDAGDGDAARPLVQGALPRARFRPASEAAAVGSGARRRRPRQDRHAH